MRVRRRAAAAAAVAVLGVTASWAAAAPAPGTTRVFVTLRAQADMSGISGSRAERQREVVRRRRARADAGFAGFRTRLRTWQQQGRAEGVTPVWAVNGFAVDATPEIIDALRADPAVAAVEPDAVSIRPAASTAEWNVLRIGAANLWALGDRGNGVVVATLDTGADLYHPDLTPGWRGGTNSWYDPYGQHPAAPVDISGHGTQVMGVILGGDTGGTAIGVAPGARWIAARVFDDGGRSTISAMHLAFQWLLDPDRDPATADAPQVVNASWTFTSPGCNLEFAQDIQNLRAAGILPVFAAGNLGAANASPANNPGAFAVGSTTATDAIAVDSSRGPSSCGEPSTTFPELTAPGVNIATADTGGFSVTASGTSLAAPHVAGALALLLSARPDLTVAQQERLLQDTAVDLGTPGPDDTFGAGRLDVQAAYEALGVPPPPPSDPAPPVVGGATVTPGLIAAGAAVVTATASSDGSYVTAAEWFEGADPGAGNGTPAAAADGAFGGASEALRAAVDSAPLAPGTHTVSLRARDALGHWGAPVTVTVTVDRAAPSVTGASATPATTAGAASVTVTAVAADPSPGSGVAAAEWFDGADPGAGRGTPAAPADGSFGGVQEGLTATIPTAGLALGAHVLGVRARDAAGNWGPVSSVAVSVTANPVILTDGFESGGLSAWTSATGRVAATAAARRDGAYGLAATLGGSPAYVTDDRPAAETAYTAAFAFNPNGADTRGITTDLFAATQTGVATPVVRVRYRRITGPLRYQLRLEAVTRRNGAVAGDWVTITSAWHDVRVAWASGTSAAVTLTVDGTSRALTGLDTSAARVDSVRLGPSSGTGSGMSGTEYLDAFASRR